MLRRRRIAKAKAIVGRLLGEAHGFTDAEVEEFTLQYMNLSEQLVFKPGDDQHAKIATQTLLHMDCNVMVLVNGGKVGETTQGVDTGGHPQVRDVCRGKA
eukprot:g14089.t1